MVFTDYLLDTIVDAETLRVAFAEALEIPPSEVCVVPEVDERTPMRSAVVATFRRGGEFSLMLSVYLNVDRVPKEIALASRLAKQLGVRILADDGSPNPYTMILVDATGLESAVSFDASRYDELDEIWLRK